MAELLNGCLPDFLRAAAAEPFDYGEWDCAMMLANWVRARLGFDPAADLRGSYVSEEGFRRILDDAGGLDALVAGLAARAGLTRIDPDEALSEDIGIVDVPTRGPAGAIRSGGFWVLKLARPLTFVKAPAIAAWRLPEPVGG